MFVRQRHILRSPLTLVLAAALALPAVAAAQQSDE